MPPKKKSEKEEKEKEVELLGPLAHTLIILGMTITLTLAFTGLLGILVLLDETSKTGPPRFDFIPPWFAEFWKKITEKNPFYTTICFNGGIVISLFLGRKLYDNRKAQQAQSKRLKAKKKN